LVAKDPEKNKGKAGRETASDPEPSRERKLDRARRTREGDSEGGQGIEREAWGTEKKRMTQQVN